jgi:hypothetical protein
MPPLPEFPPQQLPVGILSNNPPTVPNTLNAIPMNIPIIPGPPVVQVLNNNTTPFLNSFESKTFEMGVNYTGEVSKPKEEVLPDLKEFESRINNINKLTPQELNKLIEDLRKQEKRIKPLAEEVYKTIKTYERQNSV